ncbi:MAG: DUF368 domain-containing protein [Lentisphaeria bacterium]|nr:DUF368 domain-containing protein [Lentisphaeria bacterium]
MKTSLKNDLYNFAVGFFMGSANVIPGVSGGTMLFIMGAFTKLTDAIRDIANFETLKLLCKFDFKAVYHRIQWRFLLVLGAGVMVSFATLAKLMVWLLENYKQYTLAFFFGLIIASIITVNRQMKKWSVGAAISFAVSTAAAFGVISLVPVNAGSQWYMMIIYGAICIIAMILPGLSGSFLLLIFGQYKPVWDAVGNIAQFNFNSNEISMLIFLAIGSIAGLGAFVHLLNYLIKNFYNFTIAALIGFMVGAIPRIWPWQHDITDTVTGKVIGITYDMPAADPTMLCTLLCIAAGITLVLFVEFFARKRNQEHA